MKATIYRLNTETAESELVGTVESIGGAVTFNVPAGTEEYLRSIAVPDEHGEPVTIEDGPAFVDALPDGLKETYLWAEPVA